MKHITETEADKYLHGQLGLIEKMNIGKHLKRCQVCLKILDKLKADDKLLEEIKNAVDEFKNIPSSKAEKATMSKLKENLES